jgi:hypothetical protein
MRGDEYADPIDRDAALHVLGDALVGWLQANTKR